MKNLNLIKRLWTDSHEKQSPQRFRRYAAMLLMLLTLGVGQMWAYTAHFSLMGDPMDNSWAKDTKYMINTGTGTTDEWFIYAYVAKNQYFALNNGKNQYGPGTNGSTIKNGSGGGKGSYNTNSWKFTGTSGIIKICCAESNNREWYPYVWVEESAPTIKFKHPWNGGSWTEQTATKQSDGTYRFKGQYGGTAGFNAGYSSNFKYNSSATTVTGSPASGDYCYFIWNPVGYVRGTQDYDNGNTQSEHCGTFTIVKLCGLTYNGNGRTGGTAVPSALSDQKYGSSVTLSSAAMTKTGYTLTGWNTANDGSGTHYDLGASFTFSNKSNTLYAEWTQTITVDKNTGTSAGSMSICFNAGSLKSFTAATKTDWILDSYWTSSDESGSKIIDYDASTGTASLVSNVTNYTSNTGKWTRTATTKLYAHWKQTYTVTYNANYPASATSTSGSVPTDATEYASGATVTVKTNSGSLAAGGYTFAGWQTEPTGGTSYVAGSGTFSITEPTTLYAKWTEKKVSISPTVNATGYAQGYTASATVGSIGIATTTVLTADAPGEGYRFSGWTLSANLVITSGSVTDRSITVRTNGDGNTVTATANYAVDTYVRLYFQNTGSWGTVYAYVWYDGHDNEEGGKNTGWPGQATSTETICGITYNYYEFNREDHPNWDKIIFNNNDRKQTSDLDVAGHNRLFYKFSDSKWYVPTNTFYFVNTEFWDDVKLYHFGGTNGEYLGSWPGSAMDKIGTVTIDGHEYDYYGIADGICSNLDGSYIINNGKGDSSKKQTSDISSISNYLGSFFVANKCFGASSSPSASDKPSGSWYDAEGVHSATIGCPALLPFADINSISLSEDRVPPGASITATPNMNHKRDVDQAYCWGVYSDEECTSPVNVSFTSLGSGRVQFTVPQTIGTYYLKLTVRASAACNASIDDEEVQSFNVTTDNMVFFNKTDIPWSRVFVYFLGDSPYWDNDLGSGCNGRDYGKANEMHRIGKSEIYYYEYSGNSLGSNAVQYIAFTDNYKPYSDNFSGCQAAYRGDFARACAPMYVPENWITDYKNTSAGDGQAAYYNRGYWTTYGVNGVARNSGFTLKVFDKFDGGSVVASVDLTNTDGSNTYRATVNLENINYSYAYQLLSCGNIYYGNDGVMNANNSTNWKFEPDKHRCGLNSQAAGKYIFIVQCTDGGEVRVSVEYPLVNGDYRLLYNDTCVYQAHAHPSQFIRQNYSDENVKLDTVSMYIRPDKQPVLTIQRCTKASSAPPTWENVGTYDVTRLTNGHGVYNFYISQAVSSGALTINGVSPYTGLYYIRTQQADGGWTGYKTNSDNVMTYTEYAEQKNYGFNYYKAKWVGTTGADVTFTIACDYSESLCDTMVADPGNSPLTAAEARSLPHTASVRFGWNSLTNTLHRAYINGTSIVSDRYLVMIGDEKLKDSEGKALAISGLNPNEIGFTDLNNWIYRCDVKAQTGAAVRLVANYDGHTQHFIGTAEKPEEIIGGSSGEEYLMRVTYDFKTNRLMTAWLPDGDAITSNMTLKADMMLIREGQNAATQVYFDESYKDKTISEIHSIYGVMEFQYSKFANQFPNWSAPHAYEYLMYYISFPFDVKVSEIFGVGVRGENWIIQKYNGAKRAQIGWFAETSTFWETLPGDSTLHAHEGYLLLLDRISFNDPGSNVWTNRPEKVYLYFPSASRTIGTIKDNNEKVIIKIPSHTCKIERPFTPDIDGWSGGELVHSNTDSHWNVFGTPLFQSKAATTVTTVGDSELKYFYSWNYTDNTLRPEVTLAGDTVFKAMHGYMVQFAGDVTFTGAHISASVAVRRMPSNKHYLAELQLVSENGDENATYVELRENANTDFQLNEDMYMMRSSNTVDLYSFAGAYDVAANVLPIDDQLVRVGVDVKRAGTYRFTMPSEFSGTVTLIDNLMGTRTNMALGDHEVYLERGVDNNRFLLEININKMPTAIDGVDGGSLKDGKAHKFIENGQMYILKDGIIYDARGNRVQ